MEEKKFQKRHSSLWSFLKSCRFNLNFSGRSSGFTLVELLTVVGIIGILLVGAILILNPVAQFQKANDAKRKSDFTQIQKAVETYYQDHSRYPQSSAQYKIVNNGNDVDWGSAAFSPYMSTLPKDPKATRNYVYFAKPDGQSYYLYGSLEREKDVNGTALDPQLCNKGNPCISLSANGIPDASCGGTCNFAVSSPNVNP